MQIDYKGWPYVTTYLFSPITVNWWFPDSLKVSPDFRHVAFVASVEPRIETDPFTSTIKSTPRFLASVDSRPLDKIFGPNDDPNAHSPRDHIFDYIWDLSFSLDGCHFAYIGINFVREPSVEGKRKLETHRKLFSLGLYCPYFYHLDEVGGEAFVVLDGQKYGPFKEIKSLYCHFSEQVPDILKILILKNDQERELYEVRNSTLTPAKAVESSSTLPEPFSIKRENGADWVELKEARWGPYIKVKNVLLSPDGKHLAYKAEDQTFVGLFLDGHLIEKVEKKEDEWRLSILGWAPDSSACAFETWQQKKYFVKVGEEEFGPYEDIEYWEGWIQCQKQWLPVYSIKQNNQMCLVVGANLGKLWDQVVGVKVSKDGVVAYVGREGDTLYKVIEKIEPIRP